ncbi:MAG: C4-dicarboxylate ABC transporter substrate-binding protein [Hyphomicrobiaceae bacterium]|nr:MAG: C4-dicarboxylate ABC transporter substrate-binding protein [Hyphomicrobiaceae bacterium]
MWRALVGFTIASSVPAFAAQTQQAPRPAQSESVAVPVEVAQAGPKATARPTPKSQSAIDQAYKDKLNAWTVGLAAGRAEGAPLQFASELARVLDDGDNMRIVPMVTRGPFDNVFDLLYLRGVDAAIVYGDALDYFKNKPEFAGSWRRINYLVNLFPSEAHVFARPEIKSIEDLAGKTVNFNTQGTAAAYSGPIIFKQLGIDVKATFIPHSVAMEKMKQGSEVAATFWISSKPLAPFLKGKFPEGFKFLPIEYSDKLEFYTPAYLEPSDYPNLIPQGQRVATVSVPAVLAVYDWPKDTDRYQRLVRVVDYLFDRFERLQKEPGYHEKWKDVNLAGNVPGWQRFKPLQDKLDKAAASAARTIDPVQARAQAARVAPHDPAEQERLFKQFLEWNRKQGRR